ncbi:MAG: hypothetical protein IPJ81_14150 [Chitinophagaceae bacterium]|nr:hypothetical protein [Chitinophagaceae bacterium]
MGHGTTVLEMEKILGTGYEEDIKQMINYREIYYKEYNIEIVIQDEKVKYIKRGKPNWMN